MWQDQAFKEWRERLKASVPLKALNLIGGLDPTDQVSWLRRLNRHAHPVADGIGGWLSKLDSRPWKVTPGDSWEMVEDDQVVLFAYPEYLGSDPLAMCAMASVWAGTAGERWAAAARLLGPILILGAKEGQWSPRHFPEIMGAFGRAYASYLSQWGLPIPGDQEGNDWEACWAPVPDYHQYQEQLNFGVVPHEVAGAGIRGEVAVLLALYETSDDSRSRLAGLAYRAIEGFWLQKAFREVP